VERGENAFPSLGQDAAESAFRGKSGRRKTLQGGKSHKGSKKERGVRGGLSEGEGGGKRRRGKYGESLDNRWGEELKQFRCRSSTLSRLKRTIPRKKKLLERGGTNGLEGKGEGEL